MILDPARHLPLDGGASAGNTALHLAIDSTLALATCGTQNRAVFWPFGKRVMELLILNKKERVAESQ